MSKKMKKSVGKSDEERQVHLQQRAQAEEELKKKKEETLGLFLKDKLQKEQRNTAVNLLKLHDGWRAILRQTRDAELRHDIIVLQQTFERTLDDLDSIVQKLVGDVQETERQEAHMQRFHLHHMEALWALQAARLQGLQQQWERALEDVSASVSSQRQQMLEQSQQQEIQLQELTLTAELHNTDAMNDIRMLLEDTLAMYTCSLEEQVAALEGREEVSDATQTSLEHLQKSIVKVTQLEKQLADKQKKISEDLKTTKKLEDAVRRLREKMISNKAENSSLEEDLTATIHELNCRSHALQDHLTQSHTAARKRLTELTVQGDAAAKNLQAVVTKGERVLRAADICHRLETQHDTLLTSSSSQRTDECQQDTPAKDVCRFPELQQLRRSCSSAVLQREALRKHSKDLRRENEQLQLLLRQHDHHAHLPPLHVARAPTTTSTTPAARGRSHVTVIEAAHAVLKQ
ncbi:dynein regulatory complex subunit 2-like [Astatotilapia calliptera]|uniref:dynein regulatory complex subunit 2-like n=1 Tax=Astatotilapia calliptera TaxID=8154 RepID=UPI000E413FD8|nr:dynein regulatory complex subunit 2-like [Astatotilapia calliptera]XP_026038678.1 dynein regulatory complex subunit 2-like [Astatotilapia calliptera]